MEFCVLEHTADLRIRVFGDTLEQLLQNAANAMLELMTERSKVDCHEVRLITITGETDEIKLVRLLNEILFLFETERIIFSDAEVEIKSETDISVICRGEAFDSNKHEINLDIKAVTYHNMNISRSGDRLVVDIVFDV